MASLTIRNIEAPLKAALRIRSAHHGRSMEEEVRVILRGALEPIRGSDVEEGSQERNLADAIWARVAPLGGFEMPDLPREPIRDPPDFSR